MGIEVSDLPSGVTSQDASDHEVSTPAQLEQLEVDQRRVYGDDVPDGGFTAWTNVLAGHLGDFQLLGIYHFVSRKLFLV